MGLRLSWLLRKFLDEAESRSQQGMSSSQMTTKVRMKEAPNAKGRIQQKLGSVRLKSRKKLSVLSGLYSKDVKNNGAMPHNKIV